MTPANLPRLRRHTDGRWAILADPGDTEPWLTHPLQTPAGPITEAVDWLSDAEVQEQGWSELAVVPADAVALRPTFEDAARLAEAIEAMPATAPLAEQVRWALTKLAGGAS